MVGECPIAAKERGLEGRLHSQWQLSLAHYEQWLLCSLLLEAPLLNVRTVEVPASRYPKSLWYNPCPKPASLLLCPHPALLRPGTEHCMYCISLEPTFSEGRESASLGTWGFIEFVVKSYWVAWAQDAFLINPSDCWSHVFAKNRSRKSTEWFSFSLNLIVPLPLAPNCLMAPALLVMPLLQPLLSEGLDGVPRRPWYRL